MSIDYQYLEEENVNITEFINDLLSQKIKNVNTIEDADLMLSDLMQTLENLDTQIEVKKKKVQKELDTALAISEINLNNKITEQDNLKLELQQIKEEYNKIV